MYTGVWKITIFNISCFILQTIQDMAMVTMETNSNSYAIYRMVPFPMILSDPQSRHSSMSNNKLVRPVSVDSSIAAAADTKSKCKLSKNLKSVSKISSTVFLLIRTQIMCAKFHENQTNCRTSNLKKVWQHTDIQTANHSGWLSFAKT